MSTELDVLRKLVWYREGGEVSEKQWRDVCGVIRHAAGQLDASYLERWATTLGVRELLVRVTREADRER